jgi:hypothetical protein
MYEQNAELAPYDTAIDTLRIRGPAIEQDRIGRALHQVQWPQAPGESWVFVKQIKVKAKSTRITTNIVDQTRHCVEHNNDANNVVRFANLVTLLASLITDLAAGNAQQHWYWQRWSRLFTQTKSQAIASLLADHTLLLNAIVARLAHQHALTNVWQALDETSAKQLIKELAWKSHYPLAECILGTTQTHANIDPVSLPLKSIQHWQPILQPLQKQDARLHLALILIAQETVPLMLLQAPAETLQCVYNALQQPSDTPEIKSINISQRALSAKNKITSTTPLPMPVQPKSTAVGQSQSNNIRTEHAKTSQQHRNSDPVNKPSLSQKPLQQIHTVNAKKNRGVNADNDNTITHTHTQRPLNISEPNIQPQRFNTKQDHPLHRVAVTTDTADFIPDSFYTQQGGVLYLLNFLNRTPIQSIMSDYWQQLPSGWAWLYRTAELIGFDHNDPLAEFLALQLGLDTAQQLNDLPALPESDRIQYWAAQWYGQQDLWQPDLLTLTAKIQHNASHVDLHTMLTKVKLEIRLAGLDINPGWLPWLGRVVQFHYEAQHP